MVKALLYVGNDRNDTATTKSCVVKLSNLNCAPGEWKVVHRQRSFEPCFFDCRQHDCWIAFRPTEYDLSCVDTVKIGALDLIATDSCVIIRTVSAEFSGYLQGVDWGSESLLLPVDCCEVPQDFGTSQRTVLEDESESDGLDSDEPDDASDVTDVLSDDAKDVSEDLDAHELDNAPEDNVHEESAEEDNDAKTVTEDELESQF
jgi:hypothetical protein